MTSPARLAPASEAPPRYCPACSVDLSEYPYYRMIPSPAARFLLGLARWSIPVMVILVLTLLFQGALPVLLSVASGYFLLALIFTPAIILYAMTAMFPRNYRVICLRCSWYQDYAFRRGALAAEGL